MKQKANHEISLLSHTLALSVGKVHSTEETFVSRMSAVCDIFIAPLLKAGCAFADVAEVKTQSVNPPQQLFCLIDCFASLA